MDYLLIFSMFSIITNLYKKIELVSIESLQRRRTMEYCWAVGRVMREQNFKTFRSFENNFLKKKRAIYFYKTSSENKPLTLNIKSQILSVNLEKSATRKQTRRQT